MTKGKSSHDAGHTLAAPADQALWAAWPLTSAWAGWAAAYAPTLPRTTTPDSWLTAKSGNWATGADWSTGNMPTASNDATVSVAGTYTVTIAANAAANSVTLNNATAKIVDSTYLSVATNVTVTAGQFIVFNTGTLQGGTISVGAAGKFLVYNGATLSGITYQGTLAPQANATVYIQNGITVTGTGGTGSGTISLSGGGQALNFLDSETLNNLTFSFGSGTGDYLYLNEASNTSSQTLNLGSGVLISQTGGSNIIGPYNYNGGSITDAGQIALSGGTLTIGNGLGTFSDTGTIAVSGGTLDLQSTLTGSATIATTGAGIFLIDSGAIVSGTVSASGSGIKFLSGTLSAATWQGPLTLGANQTVYLQNGLTVTGANGTGAGTISLAAGNDSFIVLDNETLNNETLAFGAGSNSYLYVYEPTNSSVQTVTLGSNFTLTQAGGTNYLDGYNYGTNGIIVNTGNINVSGGTLTDNSGLSGFTNAGSITVSAGTFTASNAGSFVNTGAIVLSGGIFDLETAMTSTGSLTTSGAGQFDLGAAGVLSGTINATGVKVGFLSGTLSAATWKGPLTMGPNQLVTVENGLTVTGANGTGAGTISLAAGGDSFIVLDNETLNNETFTFGGGNNSYLYVYEPTNSSVQTVTLGTTFTLAQTGGTNYLDGYNYGTDGIIVNTGNINVAGGVLTDAAGLSGFTNAGTITVSAGAFTAANTGSFLNTGSIILSGGIFDLETAMTSTGNVITTGNGQFQLGASGILSGTVVAAGLKVGFAGGTLSAATWQGPLTLGANQSVTIKNGLTVTGAGGSGNGTINLAAGGGSFVVYDSETLNNETFTFGAGSGSNLYVYEPTTSSVQTVTLGGNFTLLQTGGANALDGYYYATDGIILNNGTISVSGGTLTDGSGLSGFTNAGIITVSGGDFAGSNIGAFLNSGTITVTAGAFTASNTGSFTNTGSIVISGGVFDLETTMASTGNVTSSGSGAFNLGAAGILSGTINGGALNVRFSAGTLSAATWQGPLTLGANQSVTIENGLTVTGAGGSGNGTISLAAGNDSFYVYDSETLNNETFTFGAGSGSNLYVYEPTTSSVQTVTLGGNFTLLQTGGANALDGYYYATDGIILNNGTISVSGGTLTDGSGLSGFTNAGIITVSGGDFVAANAGIFSNTGSIVSNGGTVDLSGTASLANLSAGTLRYGSFEADKNSLIQLTNNAAVATITNSVTLNGAGSVIESYNTTTGKQVTLDQKLTTIGTTGALHLLGGRAFTTTSAFTDSGLLQLGGSALSTGTLTIASGAKLAGTGSQTGALVDNGTVEATAGSLVLASAITGTGALQIDSGATLEIKSTSSAANTVTFNGQGALKLDNALGFASPLAGFAAGDSINLGTLAATSAALSGTSLTITLTGGTTLTETLVAPASNENLGISADGHTITAYRYAAASAVAPVSVSFGNQHIDASLGQALTITNTAPADGFSETLDGRFFATGGTGLATTFGSLTGLAAGATSSNALYVGLNAAQLGVEGGTVTLKLSSDGTGVDGAGTTALPSQTISVTGTFYAYAAPSLAGNGTLSLLNSHVGMAVTGSQTIFNNANANGYAESLDASISAAAQPGFSAAGSFTGLADGASNATSLAVTYTASTSGTYSGNATITLASDGSGIDGLGVTGLGTQAIAVTGTAYAYAAATLANGGTLALGNTHVGTAIANAIGITNNAAANGYSEALDATLGNASAGFLVDAGLSGLAAGASNASQLTATFLATSAGAYTGTAALGLVSDGTGIDGLGTTMLAGQTVTLTGSAYNYASAQLASTTINLGVVHVGGVAQQTLAITNSAAGGFYSEALDAVFGTASGAATGSGTASGIAAGATSNGITIGLNTSASGTISGTDTLSFLSDGAGIDGLGTTVLAGQTVSVTGIVDNYALAAFTDGTGPAITGGSTNFTLNLGSAAQNTASLSVSLGALNAATGLSDLLGGTLGSTGGANFTNTGLGTFSGLGAGQSELSQGVTLSTSNAGTFTETLVLTSAGSNASGYTGALVTETLTVVGTVTSVGANGGTYTLNAGPNTIVGANGGDTFIAGAGSLNTRDQLTGGAGANVLDLVGDGYFDIGAPNVFSNIPTINAAEGQAAKGTSPSTTQTIFLRDGSTETLTVAAGTAASGNTNPEGITIYGGTGADTINLAAGQDHVVLYTGTNTITLGGTANSITAGSGTATIATTATAAAAAIIGNAGATTTLNITTAGTVTLNAADTYLTVNLAAASKLTLGAMGFITANGAAGTDTITASAANQTLIGGTKDILTGATNGGDIFQGATTALSGDTIGKWTTGDVLDITNLNAATLQALTYTAGKTSGTLTVKDGTHTAAIVFSGSTTALHNFTVIGSDGHGGTLIDWHS